MEEDLKGTVVNQVWRSTRFKGTIVNQVWRRTIFKGTIVNQVWRSTRFKGTIVNQVWRGHYNYSARLKKYIVNPVPLKGRKLC